MIIGKTIAFVCIENAELCCDPNSKLIWPSGLGACDCPTPLMKVDVVFGLIPRHWTTRRDTKLCCDELSNSARKEWDCPLSALTVTMAVARTVSSGASMIGREMDGFVFADVVVAWNDGASAAVETDGDA